MNETIIVHEGKRYVNLATPRVRDGKELQYREVLRSVHPTPTPREAEKKLDAMRNNHRAEYGWVELDAWLEHYPEGYIACRFHAQYK